MPLRGMCGGSKHPGSKQHARLLTRLAINGGDSTGDRKSGIFVDCII